MVDIISPELRSLVMSRIRGKDTTPERYLASLLTAAGLRFKRYDKALPGCPDFVFKRQRLAVFVNGDFWHGWRFPIWQHRMEDFWRTKIAGNRARDRKAQRKLARLGWKALKVWEHQVESDATACVARVARALGENGIDWQAVEARRRRMPALKRRNRLPKP